MSLTRLLVHIAIITFYSISLSCRQTEHRTAKPATGIIVTDFRGKEIVLPKPATRIICLIESALSGIYMLHAEDQVIAVSSAIYNESAAKQYAILDSRIRDKKLPSPGNWDFVSVESIVSLQPDLVIIWASQTESIAAIEDKGIPVYGIFLESINDIYKEIRDLGMLTGKTGRADSLINYTQDEINKIKQQSFTGKKKNVYFMWSQGILETAGNQSTVNEMIELAGAENSCQSEQEHVIINKENLLEWDPDIIVMWHNPLKNPEDIVNLSELRYLSAIMNKQVYELPSVFFCDLWTLKFPIAVKMMAKWCYPSVYADSDPDEEMGKIILELYGKKGKDLIK